jgi:TRAP-type C4-dicarboxylate transport system permease small subunit
MKMLARLDQYLVKTLMVTAIVCCIALFFVLLGNVLVRYFGLPDAMNWYTEIVEILFAWMVMCTASVLGHDKAHLVVDLIGMKCSNRYWYYWLKLLTNLIALIFFVCLFYYGLILFMGAAQTMPVLQIPRRWAYLCIPFNAFFLCVFSVRDMFNDLFVVLGKAAVPVQSGAQPK